MSAFSDRWRHKQRSTDALPADYVSAGSLGHSQFGTPLDQILHADGHFDDRVWILVPTEWGELDPGPKEWAEEFAPLVWGAWVEQTPGAEQPAAEAVARTALELAAYGEKFGGFDPMRPFAIDTYLHLPDPRERALAVRMSVDDRPDLTAEEAAGATDPTAIEPPVVEEFHTDTLGRGLKVTRHAPLAEDDPTGAKGIFVATVYAFPVPGHQAVVTVSASTSDLGRMVTAATDLDTFVRQIYLTLADGSPAGTEPNP